MTLAEDSAVTDGNANPANAALADAALPDARALFDSFPVPGYLAQWSGEDFVLVAVNQAAIASNPGLLGILGKPLSPLYADQPDLGREVRRCLEERTVIVRDRAVRRFDLSESRELRMTFAFVPPDRVAMYVIDLTPTRRVEAALAASDERYKSVVAAMTEGMLLFNADAEVVAANQSALEMVGQAEGEVIGHRLVNWALIGIEGRPLSVEEYAWVRTLRTGKATLGSVMGAPIADGKNGLRWMLMNAQPVGDGRGGGAGGAVVIISDITDRKTSEERLRASEERYRRIIETTLEGVWVCDLDGRTTYANGRMAELLGCTQSALLSSSIFDFIVEEDAVRVKANLAARGQGVSEILELNYRRLDGSRVLASLATCPIVENGRVIGALAMVRDITQIRQAEAELRTSQERLRRALDSGNMGAWEWDVARGRGWWSEGLSVLFGEPAEGEGIAGYLEMVHPEDRAGLAEVILRVANSAASATDGADATERRGDSSFEHEYRIIRSDGQQRWVRTVGRAVREAEGTRLLGTIMDISERKQLEEQLTQSRKMDSIGRLAGGVAHDFNNLLTAILASVEFAKASAPPSIFEDLETIRVAADRAGELTRQLLAFARKQVVQIRPVDLNLVVANLERMLRRIVGEHIEIVTRLSDELCTVRGDVSQIEQVIINLAVNARDAMPGGGRLTMHTANAILDENYAHWNPEVQSGKYAMIAIHDSGVGMDGPTQQHIFEPFFTTKSGGTGMGLASCYGIVKQLGGHISVESVVDGGTTFKVYLPCTAEVLETVSPRSTGPVEAATGETVLVVEDDDLVRATVARMLRRRGYSVLVAASGEEALALAAGHEGPIHVLVSDVVMPAMSGPQLGERFVVQYPQAKVLYLSGYTDSEVVRHGVQAGMPFLQKPYTEEALARKLRELLD